MRVNVAGHGAVRDLYGRLPAVDVADGRAVPLVQSEATTETTYSGSAGRCGRPPYERETLPMTTNWERPWILR